MMHPCVRDGLQVLVSEEDLRLMIEEVAGINASRNSGKVSAGNIDLESFLKVMDNAPWY